MVRSSLLLYLYPSQLKQSRRRPSRLVLCLLHLNQPKLRLPHPSRPKQPQRRPSRLLLRLLPLNQPKLRLLPLSSL